MRSPCRACVFSDSSLRAPLPRVCTPASLAACRRGALAPWLHVSIEASSDLAAHEVAVRGWTPPEYAWDTFLTLAAHGVLALPLAKRLVLAVGLRNLLVHGYVTLDRAQLAATVATDVKDLAEFADVASTWGRGS